MRIVRLFPVIFLLAFASCKKESSSGDIDPLLAKVKTYTEDYTTDATHIHATFNLSYDNQGRVVSMISTASQGDRFEYSYDGSTATMELFNSNVVGIHEIVFLNSNSLPDSTFQYNDTQDTSTEKYIYNASKQLVKLIEYDYSNNVSIISNVSNYTYDAEGDMIRKTESYSETTYEYYPDLLNTLILNFDFSPGTGKHLVKKTTYSDGYDTVVLEHSYTFDSTNRLRTETVVADSGEVVIRTYTY
ncbi:MAG: hypothetical protein ABIO82_08055 [Ginsengibacter sp.]